MPRNPTLTTLYTNYFLIIVRNKLSYLKISYNEKEPDKTQYLTIKAKTKASSLGLYCVILPNLFFFSVALAIFFSFYITSSIRFSIPTKKLTEIFGGITLNL